MTIKGTYRASKTGSGYHVNASHLVMGGALNTHDNMSAPIETFTIPLHTS
jgi:hypothetical protein